MNVQAAFSCPNRNPINNRVATRLLYAYPNAMKLQNNPMSPNQIRQFTRIARAIEYLYDHAAEQPDLAQVAAAVHVSPEHLQREFSAWAGISPKKMLQHISISRAKEALKNSESVAEAAHSGGLSGTGRLHDLFVGIEKMTPGEYKNGGAGLQIHYSLIPGPFGDLLAAATDKGICFMRFSDDPSAALNELRAEYPNARLIGQETAFHRQAADIFRTRHGGAAHGFAQRRASRWDGRRTESRCITHPLPPRHPRKRHHRRLPLATRAENRHFGARIRRH